jgi:hypothetical protein
MDVISAYLELGLRLGRHVEGLVDSYYGPAELSERVEAEDVRTPVELLADAVSLREAVEDAGLEQQRSRWLGAQLAGLETVASKLCGEEIGYEDEVERCYGLRPRRVPEDVFEAAHKELDAALPGPGSLAERYQAWREADGLEGETLARVVDSLAADLRSRSQALVGLPAGESVEFEYVSDEPWSAFNYYLGGLCSRVEINTDVALTPPFVAELIAHETYPGHHVEHVWKEDVLVRGRSQAEETIFLFGTPQCMIAEGIASLALEILLGDDEQEVTAAHVAPTGVPYDPDLSRAVQKARTPLDDVPETTALKLHADGITIDEARDYFMRWGLASPKRADQAIRFMTDPLGRTYLTTYTDGYRLCRDFVGGDPERFKRLLTEQLTPADLVAAS